MRVELINALSAVTEEEKKYLKGQKLKKDIYTSERDMIVDSHKFIESGELIQIRPHTRFVAFPKHTHNYVEMTYVIKGTIRHVIEGKELVMNEGDLILLNQNVTQEIMASGFYDLAINFFILPEFFDKAFMMIEKDFIWEFIISCLGQNRYNTNYIYFKTKGNVAIENLLENMIWSILNGEGKRKGIIQTTMGLLLLHLSSHAEFIEFGKSSFDNELRLKVYRFIEDYYKDGELTDLAKMLGYKVYWLSREIRKVTGKSFKEILMEKRLLQAAFYLKNTNLGVTDIIAKVGYSNTSYFHRLFKQTYHQTPKEYRTQYLSPKK